MHFTCKFKQPITGKNLYNIEQYKYQITQQSFKACHVIVNITIKVLYYRTSLVNLNNPLQEKSFITLRSEI